MSGGQGTDTPRGRGCTGKARRVCLTLLVLALLALTLQTLVFSGADFLASATGTSHTFIAGSVSHANSHAGTLILDAAPLRAGGSRSELVTITGGPDVPAVYTVSPLAITDTPESPTPLSSVLQLLIEDVTDPASPQQLYGGSLAAFTVANLGVIAEGETRQVRFTVTYPATAADPNLQGASTLAELEFVGVSL